MLFKHSAVLIAIAAILILVTTKGADVLGDELIIAAEPEILYSTTDPTNAHVSATISCKTPITVTNNASRTTHVFTENGSFSFEYVDVQNRPRQKTAFVNNIDTSPPIAIFAQTPDVQTTETNATFTIDGVDIAFYKYALDSAEYSAAVPIEKKLEIKNLKIGQHTIALIGRDAAGNWQVEEKAETFSWEIFPLEILRPRSSDPDQSTKAIEVSIENQHLWAYDGDLLVFDTPVTTGANGTATETGEFAISQMHQNKWFDGGFFSTYWMRFNKGMGIHDATWRDKFGVEDYKWRGSHGCVNTPFEAAQWLYSWTDIGTTVKVF